MKVKLFTHTDLDGIGCAIVARMAFLEDVDIEFCDYDNVNEKIADYVIMGDYRNFDITYITDISVDEQVAEMIDSTTHAKQFVLLDHHKTSLWLNKYQWVLVVEEIDGKKTSGTSLLYQNILNFYVDSSTNTYSPLMNASGFVEMVRRYDTWEWKTKYNDTDPKLLNDLMQLKVRDKFMMGVINEIREFHKFSFSEDDLDILQQNQEKIDKYIEKKNKTLIIKNVLGHQAGVIFAEQYHSELGNTLAELHPEVDFIMIINPSQSVSYRTVKDVDLSVIAKMYGGGGHPKSAGSPMIKEAQDKMIQVVIDENMINRNR